jgi:hypothetical protein
MDFTKQLADKILLSIFSYLMELPSILPPSAGEPGLTLLVVCHRWRHLILHSPDIWTNLIVSPTVSSNSFNAHVKFDRCWFNLEIRRHSGYWLYISLLHDYKAPPSSQNTNTAIQTSGVEIDMLENIVFPAARRAKCLSLPFCSNHVAEAFLTTPPGRFYFLESVEMCFLKCGRPEPARLDSATGLMKFSKPLTVFQNSPFLRHLSIIINNGMNPLTLLLPWSQLTTINMGFTTIPPTVFIAILEKSTPSLSTGFFTVKFNPKTRKRSVSSDSKQNQHPPRIFAPALQHLHLRLINPSFDCHIFERFRLPALLSFRVDLYDSNEGWMMDMYYQLLRNSSNTLQRIEFGNFVLPAGFEGTDGKIGLGGPHLIIPRTQQNIDTFFSILPMVRMLRLPVGLFIPENAMGLISNGKLLPLLEMLEVASSAGVDILTMAQERNEVAYRRGGFVGSSSAVPSTFQKCHVCAPPPFFSEVVLWTSMRQMRRVESCVELIQSLSSSQKTRFRILYVDQESVV